MAKKTNALRIVHSAGILCREAFYEYDEHDLRGTHAADAVGLPYDRVFKTLVAQGDRTGYHVFCIPVDKALDLKKAAKAAGDKNMVLIPVKDLLSITGYVRGGCSPVGMKRRYPTHIDESAVLWDEIAVSAGERGHQMILSPLSLAQLTDAEFVDIIL